MHGYWTQEKGANYWFLFGKFISNVRKKRCAPLFAISRSFFCPRHLLTTSGKITERSDLQLFGKLAFLDIMGTNWGPRWSISDPQNTIALSGLRGTLICFPIMLRDASNFCGFGRRITNVNKQEFPARILSGYFFARTFCNVSVIFM